MLFLQRNFSYMDLHNYNKKHYKPQQNSIPKDVPVHRHHIGILHPKNLNRYVNKCFVYIFQLFVYLPKSLSRDNKQHQNNVQNK